MLAIIEGGRCKMRAQRTFATAVTIGVLLSGSAVAYAHGATASGATIPIIGQAIAPRALPMVSAYVPTPEPVEVVEAAPAPVVEVAPEPACVGGYMSDATGYFLWWHLDPDGAYRGPNGELLTIGDAPTGDCQPLYVACADYSAPPIDTEPRPRTLADCPHLEDHTKIDRSELP